jgi:hypothetical protein
MKTNDQIHKTHKTIIMKNSALVLVIITLFILSGMPDVLYGQEPAVPVMKLPENLLETLKKDHPRLHASSADFVALKNRIAADPTLKTWYEGLVQQGERILGEEPSIYIIPDGLRLLSTSRKVVERTYTLALLYQLTGDVRYAEREWKELEAASKFPDWNPKHFLDVGEMTHAFAIGYDWFYSYWKTDQRNIIKSAIIEKGLCRALMAYDEKAVQGHSWWIKVSHNWNQVCNGGIGMGALAIADEEPKLSEYILRQVIRYLPYAMIHFGPDGAWNEGPGYWGYSTQYNAAILSGLESSLGTDFGLSKIEGFSKTGLFPIYLTGPINRSFNYADGGDGATGGSQMYWFARKFNLPDAAIYQKKLSRSPGALDILWYPADLIAQKVPELPLAAYYRNSEVMTMRGGWNDRNTWFVGFKAGDNKANHSNLDIGSFVLDAFGKRWILDLGGDNYNMPGYFSTGANGPRWNYYRMRAEGHNVMVLNPGLKPDQDPLASAKITRFSTKGTTSFVIADLTPAYASEATTIMRGIAIVNGQSVVIQDEINTGKPSQLFWFLHTRAGIKVAESGKSAIMTMDSAQIEVVIISPSKAKFTVMEAKPLPSSPKSDVQNKNEGVRKLSLSLSEVTSEKIIVEIKPLKKKNAAANAFYKPLTDWK